MYSCSKLDLDIFNKYFLELFKTTLKLKSISPSSNEISPSKLYIDFKIFAASFIDILDLSKLIR